ncbi:hypothetical protein WA026_020790 [Henosepilachna vigintioctopunctata]|uniref:Uncharacterized protein n=1 Tax=Henosepilachna vigintioctopunctata TaxID=420089 RepID=A0AAW1TNG0_9CUCU
MKMTPILDGCSEREEGEIVDDDLEAISDDSIIATPITGKFNTHKENLRALSLSSVSDIEVEECLRKSAKKRKIRRRSSTSCKKTKSSKTHSQRRINSESNSDSDENVSLTKKLLQEAIRIDKKDAHSNSLRTRLRGMVAGPTYNLEVPKNILQITDTHPDNEDSPLEIEENKEFNELPVNLDQDDELIELRLAALKTAVMNKFQHRKKRNINNTLNKPINLDINKENSSDNVNTHLNIESTNNCANDISDNNDAVDNSANNSEEDEDILRALLLSSISKKITNKVVTPKVKSKPDTEATSHNLTNQVKSNTAHAIVPKPKGDLNIPKIPRFILSVNNSDSDSDENNLQGDIKGNKISKTSSDVPYIQREVENEVEKFLKQQRAEVEANQKLTTRDLTIKSSVLPVVSSKNAMRNSIYKLLPKSKQLEYEKLIQKLNNAEKINRAKKIPNKIDSKAKSFKNEETNVTDHKVPKNGELQRTLKDMQTQINGRLQIKGKYHVLTPLMRKMNEASQEQKRHEIRIKHLLNQLKEARNQSQKSQQSFNVLLKQFFKKKEEIDERFVFDFTLKYH